MTELIKAIQIEGQTRTELWTKRNEKGEYLLCNNGAVWFNDREVVESMTVNGIPHCTSDELDVLEVNGEIGLYNQNFERVADYQEEEDRDVDVDI